VPVRPSTAHSTIRAVTPSPPNSAKLPHLKSEHALGSPEMATYARYVLQAEGDGFSSSPALKIGGASSGRSSPVKARSISPRKRPFSTPPALIAYREGRDKEQIMCAEEEDAVKEVQRKRKCMSARPQSGPFVYE
jgi:hypothetical protein